MSGALSQLSGLISLVAAAILVWIAAVFVMQRIVLFPRPATSPRSPAELHADVEVVRLTSDSVEAWYLPPKGTDSPAPALLFAHGNGELIDDWLDAFQRIPDWGIGVMLVEYPGYGRSGGRPSQASITRVMTAAWDDLGARPEIAEDRIAAWGRSLGGGAVCALAAERPIVALILESTFTGVAPLARPYGIVGPLLRDPFDNLSVMQEFAGPALVMHGERDAIIPVEHGRTLAANAADAELHILPCGHNDCPTRWDLVRTFLRSNDLLPLTGSEASRSTDRKLPLSPEASRGRTATD